MSVKYDVQTGTVMSDERPYTAREFVALCPDVTFFFRATPGEATREFLEARGIPTPPATLQCLPWNRGRLSLWGDETI